MSSSRVKLEKKYWDKASQDPDVDIKYISDLSTKKCLNAIGSLNGKILEIGCGVGRLLKSGQYGIDISEKMIEIGSNREPGALLIKNNGRTIPFVDKFFNSVFCVLVFQHLPLEAIESYISETSRVLKQGGIFRFQFIEGTEAEPFSKHYPLSLIKSILKKNGFEIVKVNKKLVHKQWTWITARKI